MGNINNDETHNNATSSSDINKDNSYKAGETPISSTNNIENMGIAVFKNDKLIGELNGLETICHLIIANDLNSCNIQIPNPYNSNNTIDMNLSINKKTKISFDLINGTPYIQIIINLNSRILSVADNLDYSDSSVISKVENETNSYLTQVMYNYLYKTSKTFNSDINGFGKYALHYFSTIDDWNNYNWLDNYKNSFFNVNINTSIKSGYTFIKI